MHAPSLAGIGLLASLIGGTVSPWAFRPTIATRDTLPTALLQGLRYRLVGPFRGGRVPAVAGVPNDSRTFYMGTSGGGVWKTGDGGDSWHNVSDGYFGGSVGAIAVAPSDPNMIYAGTGETCLRNNVS